MKLASRLRTAGISALVGFGERSLKAQLRSANSAHVAYAVILGPDEIANGTAVLRDLRATSQETLPQGEVIPRLAGRRRAPK